MGLELEGGPKRKDMAGVSSTVNPRPPVCVFVWGGGGGLCVCLCVCVGVGVYVWV